MNQIRRRFDSEVDRFSNLETGQEATMDAALVMDLISRAALLARPQAEVLLDIGCGAGNNTLKLLQRKPGIHCHLLDLSRPMLLRAQQRVESASSASVTLHQGDFRKVELPEGAFDIVVAAAVFHHLRGEEDWRFCFQKVFSLLRPGGGFWVTDLVAHENPRIQELLWERYGDYLVGLRDESYRDEVFRYIEAEDSPRPVTYQLELLRQVGFTQVDLLHKNACFAAYGGIRP